MTPESPDRVQSQRRRTTHKGIKSISLALQGGGSHGAFTGGVLDRLLEDQRMLVEAISGTSAGAMNAVVVVKLAVSATNVRTGRIRVFTNGDLSPAAVMASACLPNLFPAVEIDGEGCRRSTPDLDAVLEQVHCGVAARSDPIDP